MRAILAASTAVLLAAGPAGAAEKPDAQLSAIAKSVDEARLRATIEKLIGFGTRHTLSDRASPTRGIGAAERWAAAQFEAMSKECGGCLEVQVPKQTFTGKRVPTPSEVGAILAKIGDGSSAPSAWPPRVSCRAAARR